MESIGQKFLSIGASYALDYLRDEEKMESIWEYLEDRASDTDTSFDDLAVSAAQSVFPSLIEMLSDYLEQYVD